MRTSWILLVIGYLATLPSTVLRAQALRDATIPFQSPRFESIQPEPILRENIQPEPLKLTPIQFPTIPRANVAPPPLQINPLPRQNFNLQPLRIQPLPRETLPRDFLQIPRLNPTPFQIDPLVVPPLVENPLPRSSFQFDSTILGFSSPLQQAYDLPPQQRLPSQSTGGTYTTREAQQNNPPRQPGERRTRQPLGW